VDTSDAELVRRVLAGHPRAFDVLVDRHHARCLRFAMHQLGERADAEEAVQDTFLRAYRALPACTPNRFGPWLTSILVNRCRTYGRRIGLRRLRQRSLDTIRGVAAPTRTGVGDDLSSTEVGRALARLPPRLREAFLLKHVEELTYAEIADMTGVGVSALKMRVRRAATRLARYLNEGESVGVN
jgi:RNA polymerase sigma-70 factor, ECF subfamily